MTDDRRRKYEADVMFEIWRHGGDPDAADYDRVDESFYMRDPIDDVAAAELRIQRSRSEED